MRNRLLKMIFGIVTTLVGFNSFGQTYTFTNCTATGRTGPAQAQVNATYTGGNTLTGNVTINTQGIQEWIVPATGTYSIEARGGQGGNSAQIGGMGAVISSEFNLTAGQTLKIVVGQQGINSNNVSTSGHSAGGGGGSYVVQTPYNTNGSILVISGGGGGAGVNKTAGTAEQLGIGGVATANGVIGSASGVAGGVAGGGGTGGNAVLNNGSSSGAGFFGNSIPYTNTTWATEAFSFVNGSEGAEQRESSSNAHGGFGGGGGGAFGGGGGGGYSGGGSGGFVPRDGGGGGGGSFNSGTNQSNTGGVNSGMGSVIITNLCTPTSSPTLATTCPSNVSVNNGSGICGAVINYTVPVGTDDCGNITGTLISGLASGAIFPMGTTTNTYSITNIIGTVTCSFTVTVVDAEAPVLNCPANITVNNGAGQCNAVVNYPAPVGTDNCSGVTTTLTAGPVSGSTFPIGTTAVTYTATDAVGNTSAPCSFTITVVDSEAPVLNCPANITVVNGAGQCDAVVNYTAPVGTDNCVGVTTALTAGLASGSTFLTGVTTVTYTATDAAGNSTPCSFTVTVLENEAPVIVCPTNIIVNNDVGQCAAVVNYTAPVGTDNCPGVTTALTSGLVSGSTFPLGTTLVTYTVTDAAGNTANCSFTVTVVDVESPTISCPANITVNNDIGQCAAVVNYTAPTGADICSGVTTALASGPASGSTFPLGVTTVTYIATDAAGNTSAPCSFTVTVVDAEAPTINCQANITVNNGAGQCDAIVNYVAPIGTDNCTGVTAALTSGPVSGSTFPVGTTTVTYTATDAAGNTTPCSFTVTVLENEAPVIVCPADITVNNDLGQCDAVVSYIAPVGTDNCPGVTTVLTSGPASGSTFSLGATTVTYTATDVSGNTASCSFTVTVVDSENPMITCSADITLSNDAGSCDAVVNYIAPIGTDNCSGVTTALTSGPASGSTFPLGITTVTYTATDAVGNTSSCSFVVTVVDSEAPIVNCPANITVNNDAGQCGAVVTYTAPVGTDNCSGVTTILTAGPASGSTFPLGATIVTYTATDAVGNTTPCSFTVTVVDVEAPVIVCPANITVNTGVGQCDAVVNYTTPVGTDNCPGVTVTLISGPASGSIFSTGITTITYVATDAAGNTSVPCSFTVTVIENEVPVIVCPGNTTVNLFATGVCDAVVTYVTPVGTDNCSGVTTVLTAGLASGSTFPLGVTTITYTVTDAAGNTASCSFTVTVVDAEVPVITCPADITVNIDPGQCDAIVNYTTPTGTDNCSTPTIALVSGPVSGSAFPLGTTTVTYTATDAVGNTSVPCSFTVTVVDTIAPSIICPVDISSCDTIINGIAPLATSDNCVGEFVTFTLSGATTGSGVTDASGSVFNVGTTTVWYHVTDSTGNSDSCSFNVVIHPLPNILMNSFDVDTVCINSGVIPLPVASPIGGIYSGSGVVGTTFDPAAAGAGLHYVLYSFTDGNSCANTDSAMIFVDICVGIDEKRSLKNVNIYPNPTNGLVHINLGNHNGTINYTISTIEGRVVHQEQNVSSNKMTINLSSESKGIYLLRIEDKSSSKVYKIIKQ